MNKNDRNVIIFGESGSGKSSLVNLVLGQNRAKVSDKAIGCTFNYQKYETPNFNLYDTVGLSEGAHGTVSNDIAYKQLYGLLKKLSEGVSLLIFVIGKGRIKQSLHENYKLFVETICMNKVPVVLVITHCEMESVQGTWWEENKTHFDKYGMTFSAVISGSSLQPDAVPPMIRSSVASLNNSTVAQILEAIDSRSLPVVWKVDGGYTNWFFATVKRLVKTVGAYISAHRQAERESEAFRRQREKELLHEFVNNIRAEEKSSQEDRLKAFLKEHGYDNENGNANEMESSSKVSI